MYNFKITKYMDLRREENYIMSKQEQSKEDLKRLRKIKTELYDLRRF